MPASVKCGATAKQPALFSRARTSKGGGYARSRHTCPPSQALHFTPSSQAGVCRSCCHSDLLCLAHRLQAELSNAACARRALQILAPACRRLWRAARSARAWPHPTGLCGGDLALCFSCKGRARRLHDGSFMHLSMAPVLRLPGTASQCHPGSSDCHRSQGKDPRTGGDVQSQCITTPHVPCSQQAAGYTQRSHCPLTAPNVKATGLQPRRPMRSQVLSKWRVQGPPFGWPPVAAQAPACTRRAAADAVVSLHPPHTLCNWSRLVACSASTGRGTLQQHHSMMTLHPRRRALGAGPAPMHAHAQTRAARQWTTLPSSSAARARVGPSSQGDGVAPGAAGGVGPPGRVPRLHQRGVRRLPGHPEVNRLAPRPQHLLHAAPRLLACARAIGRERLLQRCRPVGSLPGLLGACSVRCVGPGSGAGLCPTPRAAHQRTAGRGWCSTAAAHRRAPSRRSAPQAHGGPSHAGGTLCPPRTCPAQARGGAELRGDAEAAAGSPLSSPVRSANSTWGPCAACDADSPAKRGGGAAAGSASAAPRSSAQLPSSTLGLGPAPGDLRERRRAPAWGEPGAALRAHLYWFL